MLFCVEHHRSSKQNSIFKNILHCSITYLELHSHSKEQNNTTANMAEQEDTTMKEPRPNNPEEAKEYQKQTKIALQKFTERIHSFDRYQHQSAYEFYVHNMLNELLHTDNSYYKNPGIQPVLDTIHDKMCKFVLQPDDIDEQPSQQQSPDDIPEAEEITDKLAEIEDMEELDARSVNNITGLFAALQMCHENSAKMAGHLVQLGSTLTPKQYTYVMKHSLCPLVQISLPPCLCSPADLKFSKLHFNTPRNKRRNWHKPVLAQTIQPGVSSSPTKTPPPLPCSNYPHSPAERIIQQQRKYLNHLRRIPSHSQEII